MRTFIHTLNTYQNSQTDIAQFLPEKCFAYVYMYVNLHYLLLNTKIRML